VHNVSQTPYLDRQLQQPRTKEILQALISALNDIADENQCTQCAVQNSSNALGQYFQELRAAKKNGEWSKEEKKGIRKEIKGLAKGLKRDVKATWKAKEKSSL
jgi:hypothetical protein